MGDGVSALGEIEEDHRRSRQWVADLRAHLTVEPRPADWNARTQAMVLDLAAHLAGHFGREERGPLYLELPRRSPRFAARLTRLRREHDGLLRRLGHVSHMARQDLAEPGAVSRSFEHALSELLDAVAKHEAEETDVLVRASGDAAAEGA